MNLECWISTFWFLKFDTEFAMILQASPVQINLLPLDLQQNAKRADDNY